MSEVLPSPNHGERKGGRAPSIVVLHYTGMPDAKAALARLASPGSEVSAHYFVFEDGRIVQLVPEARRAWHAGAGSWGDETDINSASIGIEIANPGHEYGYPNFPLRQTAAVIALCRGILSRHKIPPCRVLAHSDVAPTRKQDPGEKFPWRLLHESGVALWIPPAAIVEDERFYALGDRASAIGTLKNGLRDLGYGIVPDDHYDAETMAVVAAFQRHHRPARVNGIADTSTFKTLDLLLQAVRAQAVSP